MIFVHLSSLFIRKKHVFLYHPITARHQSTYSSHFQRGDRLKTRYDIGFNCIFRIKKEV